MKTNVPENYISINKVALAVDTSVNTIKRWYQWFENCKDEVPKDLDLPKYYFFDRRGTKFFNVHDLEMFLEFQKQINTTYRGCMSRYNREVVNRKGEDKNE